MNKNKDQIGAAVRGEAVAWAVTAHRGGIHKLSITKESAERKAARWQEEWPDNGCAVRPLVFGDVPPVSARAADAPSEPSELVLRFGAGLIEVGQGHHGDDRVPAILFGRNGAGTVGVETEGDRVMLPGECIAALTFDNPESLDVVAEKLAELRARIWPESRAADALDSQPTDATRYQRLRVLGAAPCGSKQLDAGNVLRFQGLDAFIDADLAAHPSRGEASSQPTVRSSAPDGWISVKDGLPELGQTVLAVNSEYGQRESKFDRWPKGSINRSNYGEEAGYFKWQEPMNNWGSSWEPTHWRQLLTAPASSQPTDGGVRK